MAWSDWKGFRLENGFRRSQRAKGDAPQIDDPTCDTRYLGGAGLEHWLQTYFGRVEAVILDFYYATEYLAELGRALHPSDEVVREAWLETWCHRLKHQGGAAVLEELRVLEVGGRVARGALAEVVRYFTNQTHRMDYPSYP